MKRLSDQAFQRYDEVTQWVNDMALQPGDIAGIVTTSHTAIHVYYWEEAPSFEAVAKLEPMPIPRDLLENYIKETTSLIPEVGLPVKPAGEYYMFGEAGLAWKMAGGNRTIVSDWLKIDGVPLYGQVVIDDVPVEVANSMDYETLALRVRELYTQPGFDLVNIDIVNAWDSSPNGRPGGAVVRYKNIHTSVRSSEDRPFRYTVFKYPESTQSPMTVSVI